MTTEAELVAYYDRTRQYYSPLAGPGTFRDMLDAVGVDYVKPPVLDLGCGDGRLVRHLESMMNVTYDTYVGVDYAQMRVRTAREWWPTLNFVYGDVNEWLTTYDGPKFGLVVAVEVLEHLEDPLSVVEASRGLLADGGVMVGTVPINMPDRAHLQVFESADDVTERLSPVRVVERGSHWVLRW